MKHVTGAFLCQSLKTSKVTGDDTWAADRTIRGNYEKTEKECADDHGIAANDEYRCRVCR